ncbi:MAG: hypothetical protein HKN92_06525 [Chitinophagales bacterium]|nr:hypothetical protein [Chitinophagales bacterium]
MRRIFLGLLLISSMSLSAQTSYDLDALRYSQWDVNGTARVMGVGGAFGSVGADIGSITINPAGLGLFRSSELVLSPSIMVTQSETEYITDPQTTGEFNTSNSQRFYFNNLGGVFSRINKDSKEKLKGYNFALGYNRMNHFTNKLKFENQNGFSSLTNAYINSVNGLPGSSVTFDNVFHEAVLAYNTNIIQEFDTSGNYITPILLPVQQEGLWKEKGSTDMAFIALAVNVDNKYYFGGSFNFPFVRYEREYDYIETDELNTSIGFESFHFRQEYTAEGNGFNANFGVIAKPVSFMRIGASVSTPSYFSFTESTSSTMVSNFDTSRFESDYNQSFDYLLRLPWRFSSGVSFFIKKTAFVSFDYEMVGQSSSKYDFGAVNESFNNSLNSAIDTNYRNNSTFRIGAEYVFKTIRFRAGYAYTLSPFAFELSDEINFSRKSFTAGLGYKKEKFSIDAAYVRSIQNEFYVPYFLEAGVFPVSVNRIVKNNVVLTAAYRFSN